ncbi:hypothetical protein L1987_23630 [Smallanthus sonchifolius]|uniref:Uncharacterized protein n=1 Tax=Smallanthus sonchifolius TaxID=185202 RepID=A0ACB9IIS5_9ASTR|nr:hypothetical protein L1987_23630 [Smallanthus sonchifolius]
MAVVIDGLHGSGVGFDRARRRRCWCSGGELESIQGKIPPNTALSNPTPLPWRPSITTATASASPPNGPVKPDTATVEAVDYHLHYTSVDLLIPFCISVFERMKRKVDEDDDVFDGEETALPQVALEKKGWVAGISDVFGE